MGAIANHQPHYCLLNLLFRRRSKKTSKLRVTGLCEGNSPVTGELPAQMASNAENISIWWCHHVGVIIVVYCYAVPSRQLICELDENPWVLDLQMSCSDLTWRWAPILDNGHQDGIIILSVLPDSRDNSKRGGWYYQWASGHKGPSQLRRQNPNEMGKHCNESWRLKFPANRLLVIQIFQSNNNGNIRAVYCRPFIRGIYCCAAHSLAEGQ